jgi:hypothetical protein
MYISSVADAARSALLAATLVLVAAACAPEVSAPLPADPDPIGALAAMTLDGERFDPTSLTSKVVVINFWSPG